MEYFDSLERIKNVLDISNHVRSFDCKEEKEIDVLSVHLLDIQESSMKITKLINELKSNSFSNEDQVNDILFDIGEELKHILYHINESRFYKYTTYLYD